VVHAQVFWGEWLARGAVARATQKRELCVVISSGVGQPMDHLFQILATARAELRAVFSSYWLRGGYCGEIDVTDE
jgi:hypothetical protein